MGKVTKQRAPISRPKRPRVAIRALRFPGENVIDLYDDDVVVIVGPNNAGKSQLLRDIQSYLEGGAINGSSVVLEGIKVEFSPEGTEADAWVDSYLGKRHPLQVHIPMAGDMNADYARGLLRTVHEHGLRNLTWVFVAFMKTDDRLRMVTPSEAYDPVESAPGNPIQVLFHDVDKELALSEIVRNAFGQDVVVDRNASSRIHLRFGPRPKPKRGQDRLSNEYKAVVNELALLNEQGDGVRAFVGLIANAMCVDRDVQLIDEPEAFLHPPQAVLAGQFFSQDLETKRQAFLATHSSDVLRGVLEGSSERCRVLRLTRRHGKSKVVELSRAKLKEAWANPILRFSKALDGLFHEGTVVCEADADCSFYSALMKVAKGAGRIPDLHWVYGAGKSRIAGIVTALRAADVSVRAVLDFDVLANWDELSRLFEALGGTSVSVERDWKIVHSAIVQRRVQLPRSEFKTGIEELLAKSSAESLSDQEIGRIRELSKGASAWSEAKRMGRSFVPAGEASVALDRLLSTLEASGLVVVPVGEMESFCKSVAGHGPSWVAAVMETKDIGADPELDEARKFVRRLASDW